MGLFDRFKAGLEKTRKNLSSKIEQLVFGYAAIDDDFLEELEAVLLAADVGVKTTGALLGDVRAGIKAGEIGAPQDVKPFLKARILSILNSGDTAVRFAAHPPTVLLVVGVNGAGKTTSIGKLAAYFKSEHGYKTVLGAADTFRAAAVEQLKIWGERAGAEIVSHREGADPAAVAFDAVQAAKARRADILIIDTAGRLQTKHNLMEELKKINRVIGKELPGAPHETLLVLDGTSGQNALSQAKLFHEAVGVSGVVLTKLDGTAKGGIVIAVKAELDLPVKWIGLGEGLNDLQPFDAARFTDALFEEK